MSTSAHSFAQNNHGEGIYFNSTDQCFKCKSKMNYFSFKDKIEASTIIITHQRYSTSGFEIKYNHPFTNDNFVLVHNGVINNFLGKEGSDTFGFWVQFNKSFNNIKGHFSREDKIKKVIKELFKEDHGSYSILILDKKTKISYYFKNNGTDINFYENNNYLFITTNSDNHIFLNLLDTNFKELKIEDRKIYKIKDNFKVVEIYTFPEEKIEIEVKEDKQKSFLDRHICSECHKLIFGTSYSFGPDTLCESCWDKSSAITPYQISKEED